MEANTGSGTRTPCQEQPSVLHSSFICSLPHWTMGSSKQRLHQHPAQGLPDRKCSGRGGMNELSSSNASIRLKEHLPKAEKDVFSYLTSLPAPKTKPLSCFPSPLPFLYQAPQQVRRWGAGAGEVLPEDTGNIFLQAVLLLPPCPGRPLAVSAVGEGQPQPYSHCPVSDECRCLLYHLGENH